MAEEKNQRHPLNARSKTESVIAQRLGNQAINQNLEQVKLSQKNTFKEQQSLMSSNSLMQRMTPLPGDAQATQSNLGRAATNPVGVKQHTQNPLQTKKTGLQQREADSLAKLNIRNQSQHKSQLHIEAPYRNSSRIKVVDNWLDPQDEDIVSRSGTAHGINTLLPSKQRFTLQYFKNWKAEAGGTSVQQYGGTSNDHETNSSRRGFRERDRVKSGESGRLGKNKSRQETHQHTGHSSVRGSKRGNRSFGEGNIYYSVDRPNSKKMFRDDNDLVGLVNSAKQKKESTEHSAHSPSFIEEISQNQKQIVVLIQQLSSRDNIFRTVSGGSAFDQVMTTNDRRGRKKGSVREHGNNSMTSLQLATNANAQFQNFQHNYGLIGQPMTMELMFQHIQFRRIEKFMKNYLDSGFIAAQKMVGNGEKILQEIKYLDSTVFRGEVELDEETRCMYKEGQGRLIRPPEHNYSYYKQITGSWSRGILHGKRTEMRTNLDVFPIGYIQNFKSKAVKHLTFVAEVKKGIFNGPATIYLNGKKLCKTKFYDCVEMISAWNHPVGRNNFFTSDLAALNCILGASSMICFAMGFIVKQHGTIWLLCGLLFYCLQLFEFCLSQTNKLFWQQESWDDFELFKMWFFELKRCRPVIKFRYTPNKAQSKILYEHHEALEDFRHVTAELQYIRSKERSLQKEKINAPKKRNDLTLLGNRIQKSTQQATESKGIPNLLSRMRSGNDNKVTPVNFDGSMNSMEGLQRKIVVDSEIGVSGMANVASNEANNQNGLNSIMVSHPDDSELRSDLPNHCISPMKLVGIESGLKEIEAERLKMSSSQINESSDNRNVPQFEEKKLFNQSEEEKQSQQVQHLRESGAIISIPEVAPALEQSRIPSPNMKLVDQDSPDRAAYQRNEFVLEDFNTELRYSLWTDLSGEQTEFQDALEQLSYFQVLKINVFNLFDFSTMAHEMIQAQKKQFAKDIIQKLTELQKKTEDTQKDTKKIKQTVQRARGLSPGLETIPDPLVFADRTAAAELASFRRKAGQPQGSQGQQAANNKMSSSENADSPIRDASKGPIEHCSGIDDLTLVHLAIRTEMKINTKDANKGRPSTEAKGFNDAKTIGFDIDEQLNQLISSGQGLHLTLFNKNPRKDDQDDEDMEQYDRHHMGSSMGFNNSNTSFQNTTNSPRNRMAKRASSRLNQMQIGEVEIKQFEEEDEKPFWLTFWFYLVLSLFGLGWILRLIIYGRSGSANFFMKKVVLR